MAWVPTAVGHDETGKGPEHGGKVAGPKGVGTTKGFEAEEGAGQFVF